MAKSNSAIVDRVSSPLAGSATELQSLLVDTCRDTNMPAPHRSLLPSAYDRRRDFALSARHLARNVPQRTWVFRTQSKIEDRRVSPTEAGSL